MRKMTWGTILCCMVFLLYGCAGMGPHYEKPAVGLSSLRLLPPKGMAPRFEIGLHIVNPNDSPLDLKGVFYTISIEGHRVLAGASNNLPQIEPYGEGDIVLNATVDLLRGVILLGDVLSQPQDSYTYAFDAKLDVGDFFSDIVLHEKGVISLSNLQ